MFAESMLECAPDLRARRRWTLLLSLAVQSCALSFALMYPLIHHDQLTLSPPLPRISFRPPAALRMVTSANDVTQPAEAPRLQVPTLSVFRRSTPAGASAPATPDR